MGLGALAETAVGLLSVYLLLSLFCSALSESIAQRLGRRGRFLREGMRNVVQDEWIFRRMIHHPLLSSFYRDLPGKPPYPSYVPPRAFARALLDVVAMRADRLPQAAPSTRSSSVAALLDSARRCHEHGAAVGTALVPLLQSAGQNLDEALANVEKWFDDAMQRVSGWYKKRAQRSLFIVGLAVAILLNVDSIAIVGSFTHDVELRRAAALQADGALELPKEEIVARLQALESAGLPIGFSCLGDEDLADADPGKLARRCWSNTKQAAGGQWLLKIVGWLITALAVRQGAPFWFDLSNRVVNVRGAGAKPETAGGS